MTTKATSPAEIRQLKFAIRTQTFGLPPTEHRFIDTLLTLGRAEAINAALEAYADHLSADPSGGSTLGFEQIAQLRAVERVWRLRGDAIEQADDLAALLRWASSRSMDVPTRDVSDSTE